MDKTQRAGTESIENIEHTDNIENPESAQAQTQPEATEGKSGFKLFAGDKVLWIILATLGMISILVVYSSSAKMGYSPYESRTATDFLLEQIKRVSICAALILVVHRLNCRLYNRLALLLFVGCTLLTAATYFTAQTTNGAARWILGIQPSEALKIATVVFLARQLAARQAKISRLRIVPSLDPRKWFKSPAQKKIWREGTIPVLLPVVIACGTIVTAHTSSAILVFAISMIMMYVGRVKGTELLKVLGLAAAAGIIFLFAFKIGRSDTATSRVGTWKDLWTKSWTETSIDRLPDTERAMIAIHEGGLFGRGAGRSLMRVKLTHPECDYTFALFVEEYGMILAVIMMIFYLWISVRGIVIFTRCETAFPSLLVLGLVLLITLQALLHVMVAVNLIPETGQTLPFVSRGGSSMFFSAIAMGMVLGVSRQNDEKSHDKPRGESIVE